MRCLVISGAENCIFDAGRSHPSYHWFSPGRVVPTKYQRKAMPAESLVHISPKHLAYLRYVRGFVEGLGVTDYIEARYALTALGGMLRTATLGYGITATQIAQLREVRRFVSSVCHDATAPAAKLDEILRALAMGSGVQS